MATTALSYMKNVAKSFGYSFADNFNEMNPTVSALFRESKSLTENLYSSISDFKAKTANVDSSITSQIKDTTKEIWQNLNSDLRTGKWYNKARQDKAQSEAMLGGLDFDDFGDFDFDDDDTTLDEQASIQEDATRAMSKAMDAVGNRTASAIATATVNSANYIVQSSRVNTRALYALNTEGFGKVTQGIAAVNTNISTLVKLGEPLTKHMQNSSVFFARSNEYQEKSLKLLEQLVQNTSPKDNKKTNRRTATTIADIFTSEGLIDINRVKELAKSGGSGGGGMGELGLMLSMLDMFGGPMGAAKAFASSPTAILLPLLTGQLFNVRGRRTGKSMRDAFKDFNNALSGAFAGGLAKFQDKKFGNSLLGSLGSMLQGLIPKSGVKNKFNPGDYVKGPVDWDGQSRMALMNVIPTQLGKILSALTGEEEVRFDYKTGKWVKVSGIHQMRQNRLNSATATAGGDLLFDLRRSVERSGMSQASKTKYNRELSNFFEQLMLDDDTAFLHLLDSDFNIEKYRNSISPAVFKDMQKRLREIRRRNPHKYTGLARNMYSARAQYGRGAGDYDSLEMQLENDSLSRAGTHAFGTAGRASLYDQYKQWKRTAPPAETKNVTFEQWRASDKAPKPGYYKDYTTGTVNTAGAAIMNQVDEYGKNQLFYLNGIYQFTGYIAKNLKFLVPGRSRGKGNRVMLEPAPIVQASKAKTDYIGRESVEYETHNIGEDAALDADIAANSNIAGSMESLYGSEANVDKLSPAMRDYYYRSIEDPSIKTKEMDKKLADALDSVGRKDKFKDKINSKWDKVKSKSKIISNMQETLGVTSDEVSTVLASVTESINGMIYGKDEKGVSLMDSVKTGISNIFDTLTLHIKDYIPEPVKKFFGSLWDSDFVKDIREETKKTFKSMFGWFFKSGKTKDEEGPGASGSGLRRYISRENRAYYGHQHNRRYLGVGAGASAQAQADIDFREDMASDREYHSNAPKKNKKDEDSDDDSSDGDTYSNATRAIVRRVSNNLIDRFQNALTNLFGKNKPEEERKVIRKNIEKLMGDVSGAKGAIGAGALTGAGVSLLSGAFLGPIAGAAIGASVGFVAKSKTAQDLLFGEQDEDGKRKGGVFTKQVSNFIYDHVPSMAKGGAAGMVGGLFLGSPVLGAILGSTVGYVSSSEKAKEVIFGKLDEEGNRKGGIISKELQNQVKKAVPSMAKGAALMTLFGPAVPGGIVGKLLIGSALGFATSTDRFKTWFFGKDEKGDYNKIGKGGFSELINQKLFMPVVDLFKNMTSMVTTTIKDVAHSMGKKIRDFILKRLGGRLKERLKDTGVGRFLGKAGDKLARGALNVITAPTRGLSNLARTSNIKHGRAAYLNGRLMGVEDRVNYMKGKIFRGNPLYSHFDKDILMNIKDDDEAMEELKTGLSNLRDWKSYYNRQLADNRVESQEAFQGVLDRMGSSTEDQDKETQKKLIYIRKKLLKNGNVITPNERKTAEKELKSLLTAGKITREEFESIVKTMDEQSRISLDYINDERQEGSQRGSNARNLILDEIRSKSHGLGRLNLDLKSINGNLKDSEIDHMLQSITTQQGIRAGNVKTPEVEMVDESKQHTTLLRGILNVLDYTAQAMGVNTEPVKNAIANGTGKIKAGFIKIGETAVAGSDLAIDAATYGSVAGARLAGRAIVGTAGVAGEATKYVAHDMAQLAIDLKTSIDALARIASGQTTFESNHPDIVSERREKRSQKEAKKEQKAKEREQRAAGDQGSDIPPTGAVGEPAFSGARSGLYRKLRRYGIGGGDSGLDFLNDDQSESEEYNDATTDTKGEDETTTDQFGNVVDNEGSTKAREKKKNKNTFLTAISNLPVISGGINKLVEIADVVKNKLIGDEKEKKEGFFSKIIKILTTVGSIIFSLINGDGLSDIISKILGGGKPTGGGTTIASIAKTVIDNIKGGGGFFGNWADLGFSTLFTNQIKSLLTKKDPQTGKTKEEDDKFYNDLSARLESGEITQEEAQQEIMKYNFEPDPDNPLVKKVRGIGNYIREGDTSKVPIINKLNDWYENSSIGKWQAARKQEKEDKLKTSSGAISLSGGFGSGLPRYGKGAGASGTPMQNVMPSISDLSPKFGDISGKINAGGVSGDTATNFSKQIEKMQDYALNGNTEGIWRLRLDPTSSSSGVAGPLFNTMFDFSKTVYSMLSVVTGLLMPMQATISGVNSGLEYITGTKATTYSGKNGGTAGAVSTTTSKTTASGKATTFAGKVKSVFNKVAKGFKNLFGVGGGSGSGLVRRGGRPSFSGFAGGTSGLYPLFGFGAGKTVKDTKGNQSQVSKSVDNTKKKTGSKSSSKNLDYGGNDVDHPFTDQIWSYLKSIGFSDHAAAGILGNIRAESGGDYAPYRVQYRLSDNLKSDSSLSDIKKKYESWGIDLSNYNTTDETYTKAVDGGKMSKKWFRNPRGEGTQDGYGLVQFTYPPYKDELYEKAKEKKTSVGNMAAQLDVLMNELKGDGVYDRSMKKDATYSSVAEDMLKAYEKPSGITQDTVNLRVGYAKDMYDKYKGSNPNCLPVYGKSGTAGGKYAGSTDDTDEESSGSEGGTNSSGSSEKDDEVKKTYTIVDKIKQAFYDGFTSLFGGKPGSEQVSSTSTKSSKSEDKDDNDDEDSKGDTSSNNPFAGVKKQPYQIMQGWKGKLVYSQQARDPHNGSSDCSSTVQAAIIDAGGPDVGGWTNPQAENRSTMKVVKRDTGGISEKDVKLVPNDVLLYQCNYSLNDPSYIDGIGHAAMYVGNGKMIEQTSRGDGSKGTYESDMRYNRLVQVSRVKASKVKGSKKKDSEGGGASGFTSQLDPAFDNIRVGGKSMADNGCGPASAAMALGSLGRGIDMGSAADLANQYQTTGGTDAAYFRDIFSRNGIGSDYVTGSSVKDAVAGGGPVVLMGQDRSNRSKANSPFGPNNHYVVAEGMDSDGNVNIADPESGGMHKYSSKILDNVKVGVAATGSAIGNTLGGIFGYGAGKSNKKKKKTTKDNSDIKKVIWDYLRSKLKFTEEGSAGAMGCWEAESGNNPDAVEGNYLSNYPGTKKIFSNPPKSFEDYTLNTLFPAYAASNVSVNKDAYKMDGKYAGHYAPGLGLGQWTGPRASHLLEYAKKHNEDWKSLAGQLDFGINGENELKSRKSLFSLLKKTNSVDEAVSSFYKDFESGGRTLPSGDPRWGHAKTIYNKYKGTDVTTDLSDFKGSSSSDDDDEDSKSSNSENDTSSDSSNESEGKPNVLQQIVNAFSSGFTKLFGGEDESSSDSGDKDSDSDKKSGSTGTDKTIEGGIGAADGSIQGAFIDYACSINKYMLAEQKKLPRSKQWRYGNRRSTTFENAVKRKVRQTQCDGGVCWIVRHFNVIGKHESHNDATATGLPSLWNKLKKTQDVHIHPGKKVRTLMKEGKLKGPTVFRTPHHCFMYLGDYNGHSYWWDSGHKSQGHKSGARFGDAHKGGWVWKLKKGKCINGDSTVVAYYNIVKVDKKYLKNTVSSKGKSSSSDNDDISSSTKKYVDSSRVASNAVKWAHRVAKNNKHGYKAQGTAANAKRDFKGSKSMWGNPDYSCTTLVTDAYRQQGINISPKIISGNTVSKFKKAGFKRYSYKGQEHLVPGDVLVAPGHAAMFYKKGKIIQARGNFDHKPGDGGGGEIAVSGFSYSKSPNSHFHWTDVLRYPRDGGAGASGFASQLDSRYSGKANTKKKKGKSGKGSGLYDFMNYTDYAPSASGQALLADTSGRFSGGFSSISNEYNGGGDSSIKRTATKPAAIKKTGSGVTINTSTVNPTVTYNTKSSTDSSSGFGISKETAALLKVIISLVEQLITNTNKVDSIYDILEEYCKSSGNSELESAVTRLNQGGAGSGKKKSSYVPSSRTNQATINSLSDLKDICDRILVG